MQITFKYGHLKNIRLTWGHEYEIVERLKAHDKPWNTIPEDDLQNNDDLCASLEVELCHVMLKENVNIMVPPDCHPDFLKDILNKHTSNILPVIIYAVSEDLLDDIVCLVDFIIFLI